MTRQIAWTPCLRQPAIAQSEGMPAKVGERLERPAVPCQYRECGHPVRSRGRALGFPSARFPPGQRALPGARTVFQGG